MNLTEHDVGRLRGRQCIVTGAAQGIGRAIASRLLAEGATVTVFDLNPVTGDLAMELGPNCRGAVVDVGDVAATKAAVRASAESMGGLWLLVNNAGVFGKTPLVEIDPDEWDRMMEINVRSMLVTTQAAAPFFVEGGGGRIVNQASMAAKLGSPGEAHYAASKAAVVALTRITAMELGPDGVTANAICPGYVLTEMGADTRDPSEIAEWTSKSPLGRLATPEDVAGAVAYLASGDGAYITGESLNVSGGMCTW